jgi:hypothetical protein
MPDDHRVLCGVLHNALIAIRANCRHTSDEAVGIMYRLSDALHNVPQLLAGAMDEEPASDLIAWLKIEHAALWAEGEREIAEWTSR